MPLTVEDGSGLATADSYGTVAGFREYIQDRYQTPEIGDDDIEAALRRGTLYIDYKFRDRFMGIRSLNRLQRLEWPRSLLSRFPEVATITDDEVPYEVVSATYEAAYREVLEPGSLLRDYRPADIVTREKIGPLETQYAVSGSNATQIVLPVLEAVLAPVLKPTSMTVFAQRC